MSDSTFQKLLQAGLFAAALGAAAPATAGLDPESNTDGFDPAANSYRINESRRLNAVARQLELNYRMLWEYGFDPANPPVDQPIGYESGEVAPDRWRYRPVYPEPVAPSIVKEGPERLPAPTPAAPPTAELLPADGPALLPPTPAQSPAVLPAPADATPTDRIPPRQQPSSSGPREL